MLKKKLIAATLVLSATSVMAGTHHQPDVKMEDESKGLVSLGFVSGVEEGYKLGLSYEFAENISALGEYRDYDDVQVTELGLAYDHAVTKHVSLVPSVKWMKLSNDLVTDMVAEEQEGIVLSLAAHAELKKGFHLTAGVERVDFNTEGSAYGTDFFFGAGVDLTKDLTVSVEHRDLLDETGVTLSWSF